jgi:hypothetical protein
VSGLLSRHAVKADQAPRTTAVIGAAPRDVSLAGTAIRDR